MRRIAQTLTPPHCDSRCNCVPISRVSHRHDGRSGGLRFAGNKENQIRPCPLHGCRRHDLALRSRHLGCRCEPLSSNAGRINKDRWRGRCPDPASLSVVAKSGSCHPGRGASTSGLREQWNCSAMVQGNGSYQASYETSTPPIPPRLTELSLRGPTMD